jgi:hypothetical protein
MTSQRHLRASFALVFIPLFLMVGCKKAEWKEFRSTEGRFSVMVPDDLKESSQNLSSPLGPLTMHMFQEDEILLSMMCAYTDFPMREGVTMDPEKAFDGSRNEIAKSQNATVVSETPITVDGNPGRLIVMTKSGGLNLKLKLVWASPRYYEVLVVAQDRRAGSEDIDRFLDSFKVLP